MSKSGPTDSNLSAPAAGAAVVGASLDGGAGAVGETAGDVVYMRLLDFVVSQALQVCSRALQLVRPVPGDESGSRELNAQELAELESVCVRLMAAWQLVRKRIGKPQYRHAAARVKQLNSLLPATQTFGRVAQNLLDRASPAAGVSGKTRAALRQVMDEWSSLIGTAPGAGHAVSVMALSRLLQEESTAWRLAFAHRGYSNKALIVDGFGRTYRRARRMGNRMVDRQRRGPLTRVQLRRYRRRVLQVTGQLELMGDNLSDANKRTLWYLHRLERNLARQAELIDFAEQIQAGDVDQSHLSRKSLQRVLAAVADRQQVLRRRGLKLQRRGLQRGTTAYCRSIAVDSAKIHAAALGAIPQLGVGS